MLHTFPTLGSIIRERPELDRLLSPDARLEVLASGFVWSEGPLWLRGEGALIFSDIPQNSIFRWSEEDGITLWMKPSGYTGLGAYSLEPGSNGLTLDAEGRVLFCEHGDRRVSRLEHGGGKRTLADSWQGRRLNSPNDIVVHSSGAIYFTDPPYGLPKQADDPGREMDFCGVFRIDPSGEITLLTDEISRPNGLAFSPDESVLYVGNSETEAAVWRAYPVQADGSLGKGRIWADATYLAQQGLPGAPDGFKVDVEGNVWTTGPGGILIFSPTGELLGRINTGGIHTSNCAWGDDGDTLYITVDMYLCRIRTLTRGAGW